MIYNLYRYLLNLFSTYNLVVDGWEIGGENESIAIIQTGGDPQHWYKRQDYTVQFIGRGLEKVPTKQKLDSIYQELRNRFGLILPEITVESVTYPELLTAQVSPLQVPGYIGVDDNKRHMYSFNVLIVVGG